jgi:hypothetical protein
LENRSYPSGTVAVSIGLDHSQQKPAISSLKSDLPKIESQGFQINFYIGGAMTLHK